MMKQYQLLDAYMNYPKGAIFSGPYLTVGGGKAYFTEGHMPGPEGGTQGIFSSFVENNPDLFKEIVNLQA